MFDNELLVQGLHAREALGLLFLEVFSFARIDGDIIKMPYAVAYGWAVIYDLMVAQKQSSVAVQFIAYGVVVPVDTLCPTLQKRHYTAPHDRLYCSAVVTACRVCGARQL